MLAITGKLNLQTAVARRVGQMQSSNHEPIEVLGTISFDNCDHPTRQAEIVERELHLKYAHLARFKPGTKGAEWFNSSPELLSEISRISAKPESAGIPRCYAALASQTTG